MITTDPRHMVLLPHRIDHDDYLRGSDRPCPIYPLRRRGRWARTCRSTQLLPVVRDRDGCPLTAGGKVGYLDLPGLAQAAHHAARLRWWTWKTQVARGSPRAREWESFLAWHRRSPRTLSMDEARRRFSAQSRVLVMTALNGLHGTPFRLDPYDLAAFQAGEAVYCTLAWQQALVGTALVTGDGELYRAASSSVADRLRYLRSALDVVHALPPDGYLVAVTPLP